MAGGERTKKTTTVEEENIDKGRIELFSRYGLNEHASFFSPKTVSENSTSLLPIIYFFLPFISFLPPTESPLTLSSEDPHFRPPPLRASQAIGGRSIKARIGRRKEEEEWVTLTPLPPPPLPCLLELGTEGCLGGKHMSCDARSEARSEAPQNGKTKKSGVLSNATQKYVCWYSEKSQNKLRTTLPPLFFHPLFSFSPLHCLRQTMNLFPPPPSLFSGAAAVAAPFKGIPSLFTGGEITRKGKLDVKKGGPTLPLILTVGFCALWVWGNGRGLLNFANKIPFRPPYVSSVSGSCHLN